MESIFKITQNLLHGKYKRISRFSMIGIANTLIDFFVFTILNSLLGINYTVSQALGYSSGVANSFIFNKNWTFQDGNVRKQKYYELLKFIGVNLITLIFTTVVINFLVKDFNINVYIAKIIVTIMAQVTNFLAYKLWIFK